MGGWSKSSNSQSFSPQALASFSKVDKRKGIDLAPKTIPPEVFDKRAVEKGQVRFADVSYIEATPRYDRYQPAVRMRTSRSLLSTVSPTATFSSPTMPSQGA